MDTVSSGWERFPSNVVNRFKNFKLLCDQKDIPTSVFLTYSATSINDGQSYTIRVLNHESLSYKKNRNQALTLYFQELFYLCARFGTFTCEKENSLEICDSKREYSHVLDLKNFAVEGENIAFVMKETQSLKSVLSNEENKSKIDVERLIKDVLASLSYINSNFTAPYISLTLENIYAVQDVALSGQPGFKYYIASWAAEIPSEFSREDLKLDEEITKVQRELAKKGLLTRYAAPEIVLEQEDDEEEDRRLQSYLASEIYSLGLVALEVAGIDYKTWKFLPHQEDSEIYGSVLETIVQRVKKLKSVNHRNYRWLGNLFAAMLKKDSNERIAETTRVLKDFMNLTSKLNPVSLESLDTKELDTRSVEEKEEEKEKVRIADDEREDQNREASLEIENTTVAASSKLSFVNFENSNKNYTRIIEILECENITRIKMLAEPLDCIDAEILKTNETWTNLEAIDISDSGIRNQNQIAAAIGSNNNWKNLRKLALTKIGMSSGGAEMIGRNTSWLKLEELDLSNNDLGDKGVVVIGNNTTWKNLKKLCLRRNRISDEGAISIGRNLTWVKLEELQLSENSISDKGTQAIGSNTVWSNLKVLFLNNNNIHDEGAAALARNTLWVNLELLSLSSNWIEDKGAEILGGNMTWKKLKYFGLERNPFVKHHKGSLTKESPGAIALYQNKLFGGVIIPR